MQWLRASDDLGQRRPRDLVALPANQHAGLAVAQGLHRADAQSGRQNTIECTGWRPPHDVAKRGGTQLEPGALLIRLEVIQNFRRYFP